MAEKSGKQIKVVVNATANLQMSSRSLCHRLVSARTRSIFPKYFKVYDNEEKEDFSYPEHSPSSQGS
jgi:hypothetical protein